MDNSVKASRSCVILNDSAGFKDKEDLAGRIEEIFRQRGKECMVVRVDAGMDIVAIASNAIREGADRVVAGGGDGTLRAVSSALVGTGVPLGVLPAGTLNHFARDLEIPLDLEEAAAVAAEGTAVDLDVAEVNGHVFLNNSVLGLYPFYRGHRDLREAAGSDTFKSMLGAVVRTLRRYPRMTLRVQSRGLDLVRSTPYVMIANNEHAMEGFKPWARESITEGSLCVYILRDRTRLGLLRLLAKIVMGGRLVEEEFEPIRAAEVTIETRARRMQVSLDGEMLPLEVPLRYRSRPGQLKVLVPAGSKRAREVAASPVEREH
jgi:diacylglycerol kinase family enzyme